MESGNKDLGEPGSDLFWREAADAHNLFADKDFRGVEVCDLGAGMANFAPSKIHPELKCRLFCLRELLRSDDGTNADVEELEI